MPSSSLDSRAGKNAVARTTLFSGRSSNLKLGTLTKLTFRDFLFPAELKFLNILKRDDANAKLMRIELRVVCLRKVKDLMYHIVHIVWAAGNLQCD